MDSIYVLIGTSGGHYSDDQIKYRVLMSSTDKDKLHKICDELDELLKLKPTPQNAPDIFYSHLHYNYRCLWEMMEIEEVPLV